MIERLVRSSAVGAARKRPRHLDEEAARRRVHVVLMTAYGVEGSGVSGIVRSVLNLVGYLAANGYEVHLISVYRNRDKPFFELPEGVRVHVLDDQRRRLVWNYLRPIRALLRSRPSALMHPDDVAYQNTNLWTDWRLGRALRRRTGFLVTTRPGLNLSALALKPPGLILIGQEHMNLGEHSDSLQEAIRREYPKLATLTVLTPRDRKAYLEHLPERRRLVRIPNAVRDLGGVRADLSANVVLAAGRFVRQKGYDRLIRAWSLVAPKHPDWRLEIYGQGPRQERLEGLIDEYGLQASVSLAPPVEDMGALMARSSIFALSSRWEGLPLVLLEAMSVGMAVVSFDCPTGPASVIEDHVNGLLIRPRTIANFAAGLEEMISDESLRRRCSVAAIETMREYRMEEIGPRWVHELEWAWKRTYRPDEAREELARAGGSPSLTSSSTTSAAADDPPAAANPRATR
jgi:glycosyltransferase involved in cell wall biosynthesis